MKQFISQNKYFLFLYLVFLITGGILIAKYEKGDEILYFSSIHTPLFDEVFKWVTRIAEAPLLVLLIVIALRFGLRNGVILGLNCLITFVITQAFKYLVFSSEVRPSVFFQGKAQLNFVQGVEVFQFHSFPSGHTSTAFALFFMLSILVANKNWSFLFFPLALLVGISRVYLLEHFFRDIYFGAALGMCVTIIFYLTFASSKYFERLQLKGKELLQ